jgi:hypothetical protein
MFTRSPLLRATALACVGTFLLCATAGADILVAHFGSFGPSAAVLRYRESDGAFLGTAGFADETLEDFHIGPNGNLYIATNGLGLGAIRRYNWMTGTNLGDLVTPGQNGYRSPNEFVFGTDGNVYATSRNISGGGVTGVMKFNGITGAYQGLFIAPGSGGITEPYRIITIPGNGDFLVSDGQRINRYSKTTGAFISTFLAPGAGGFNGKGDMLFGPDGKFYVVDQDGNPGNNAVARFDGTTGAFLGMFIAPGSVPNSIGGIAFGNDGNFYVSRLVGGTTTAGDVRRFDGTTGNFLGVFINDPAHLLYPTEIFFTPEPTSLTVVSLGLVLVTRRCNRRRAL